LKDVPEDFAPRPFCSQRCKLVDLHNWLTESYRISTPLKPGEAEDDEYEFNH
jgi:endogenous inhibitor of DNA gyrase (YacG/DUF329 family)